MTDEGSIEASASTSDSLPSPSQTAVTTVLIALVLFAGKLAAAWASGSIGLLSTAIDSGLDLGMSLVVLGGIRLAQIPADPEHPYGHGKFESVAGLVEAGVLAAVGVLVATIGVVRILDPTPLVLDGWMVAVLLVSAVVGAERGYALWRGGRAHGSTALSVDAWHYGTDVVTSLVGLTGAWLATRGLAWADGGAAVIVGAFLAAGSIHVAWKAAGDLVDRVPATMTQRVESAIGAIDRVEGVERVRVRGAGPDTFVDATVLIPRALGLERAHDVMDDVEAAVEAELGGADVTVHAEPVAARETAITELKVLAARDPAILGIHEIHVDEIGGGLVVDCHVEVDDELTLEESHGIAQRFEDRVKAEVAEVEGIHTHIEPMPRDPRQGEDVTDRRPSIVERIERGIEEGRFLTPGGIEIKQAGENLEAIVTARMEPGTDLVSAHEAAEKLERRLLEALEPLDRVIVHVEPEGPASEG